MKVVLRPTPAAALAVDGRSEIARCAHPDVSVCTLGRDRPLITVDGELDPATVHGLVARASDPKRERWSSGRGASARADRGS
jgi:hypothetical protein